MALLIAPLLPPVPASAQAPCGTWTIQSLRPGKDERIEARLVRQNEDCSAIISLHNRTGRDWRGIDLGNAYSLQLTLQAHQADWAWTANQSTDPSELLVPVMALDLTVRPTDPARGALVTVQGDMNPTSVVADSALFFLHVILQLNPLPTGCLIADDELSFAAIRAGTVLEPVAGALMRGDFNEASALLTERLDEFLNGLGDYMASASLDCGVDYIKHVRDWAGDKVKVALLTGRFVSWIAAVWYDALWGVGTTTGVTLTYQPAQTPTDSLVIGQVANIAGVWEGRGQKDSGLLGQAQQTVRRVEIRLDCDSSLACADVQMRDGEYSQDHTNMLYGSGATFDQEYEHCFQVNPNNEAELSHDPYYGICFHLKPDGSLDYYEGSVSWGGRGTLLRTTGHDPYGPDTVWEGKPGAGWSEFQGCLGDQACALAILERSGASTSAVAFFQAIQGEGYANRFEERGRVDMIEINYPARAHDNFGYALVNGDPDVVRADDWDLLKPITDQIHASALGQRFPDSFLWAADAEFVEDLSPTTAAQSFVFRYPFLDCHACDIHGTATVEFSFDAQGRFRGASLASVSEITATSTTP